MLQRLEKLEFERMEKTKVTFSKYVANTYTVIPTIRQLCDRLIFFTDQVNPPNQISQFVHSVVFSLKEPLKAPKIPRYRPFGDAGDSYTDDEIISNHFNQVVFSIQSSYNVKVAEKLDETKNTTETVNNDDDDDNDYNEENQDDETQPEKEISTENNENNVQKSDRNETLNSSFDEPPITAISIEENDSTDQKSDLFDTENKIDTESYDTPPVEKKVSGAWVDDFLAGGTQTPGGPDFTVPSSNPFETKRAPTKTYSKIITASKNEKTQVQEDSQDFTPKSEPEPVESKEEEEEEEIEEQIDLSTIEGMKTQLQKLISSNDYYCLFEVTSTDDIAKITAKRKEINLRLHPDNFVPDSKEKKAAVVKLVKVNDVFNSVFRNEKTKNLYDKLCAYRKKYNTLLEAPDGLLQRAVSNLNLVGKAVKRANLPEDLYEEVSLVLQMIEKSRGITPQ